MMVAYEDPFETAYRASTERSAVLPWDVGRPQGVVVELERAGRIRGRVLDVGCGTGEHTLHLAGLGYEVVGVDSAPSAIAGARDKAHRREVSAVRFEVADALALEGFAGQFDTVLDVGLFHLLPTSGRGRYVAALHRSCRPGAVVHVLSLSDEPPPGFPPGVGDADYRDAFGSEAWIIDEIRPAPFACVVPNARHGRRVGEQVDVPGWLASVRRR